MSGNYDSLCFFLFLSVSSSVFSFLLVSSRFIQDLPICSCFFPFPPFLSFFPLSLLFFPFLSNLYDQWWTCTQGCGKVWSWMHYSLPPPKLRDAPPKKWNFYYDVVHKRGGGHYGLWHPANKMTQIASFASSGPIVLKRAQGFRKV